MEQLFTVLLTIVSGVIVFVICEYIKDTWLDALQKYKLLKYNISSLLCYYANRYTNPVDIAQFNNKLPVDYEKGSDDLRKAATELRAFIEVMPWLRIGIPSKETLFQASNGLIGLSNSFSLPYKTTDSKGYGARDGVDRANEVSRLLHIYPYPRKDD